MKLEQQVVSLELAKRLKELGVKQDDSLFYWQPLFSNSDKVKETWRVSQLPYGKYPEPRYAALTAAELGEMLPAYVQLHPQHQKPYLECSKNLDVWNVGYNDRNGTMHFDSAEREADARAKLLIYLIQNNLITP